jgi:PRTRC genetic system protein B
MNNFILEGGEKNLVLTQAILLYSNTDSKGNPLDEIEFASLHDVENVGTKANPNEQVMAGRPITREALLTLYEQLAQKHALNTDFLPENVLSISTQHCVWWCPAQSRQVFFNTKELGKRGAVVPHPPLVFMIAGPSWYVFALSKNERPTEDTKLCHAPYFNVYDAGGICTGSAKKPDAISVSSIPDYEEAFFDSEFTHISGSTKRSSHPRGEYALWKELLDGKYEAFPLGYLVHSDVTLGTKMQALRKILGTKNAG